MIKNDSFFLYCILLATSVLLTIGCSRWIDTLYKKNAPLIQTPVTKKSWRYPFLIIGFLISGYLFVYGTNFVSFPSKITAFPQTVSDTISFLLLIPAVTLLLVITVTDLEQRLIFDITTLPLALLGLAHTITAAYTASSFSPLLENLLAAAGGGLIFLLLAILTQGGIGGGDIKLIAALGLWLGPNHLTSVTCIGIILGGLISLLLLITGRKKRGDAFAYGPCFTLPALLYLLAIF